MKTQITSVFKMITIFYPLITPKIKRFLKRPSLDLQLPCSMEGKDSMKFDYCLAESFLHHEMKTSPAIVQRTNSLCFPELQNSGIPKWHGLLWQKELVSKMPSMEAFCTSSSLPFSPGFTYSVDTILLRLSLNNIPIEYLDTGIVVCINNTLQVELQ